MLLLAAPAASPPSSGEVAAIADSSCVPAGTGSSSAEADALCAVLPALCSRFVETLTRLANEKIDKMREHAALVRCRTFPQLFLATLHPLSSAAQQVEGGCRLVSMDAGMGVGLRMVVRVGARVKAVLRKEAGRVREGSLRPIVTCADRAVRRQTLTSLLEHKELPLVPDHAALAAILITAARPVDSDSKPISVPPDAATAIAPSTAAMRAAPAAPTAAIAAAAAAAAAISARATADYLTPQDCFPRTVRLLSCTAYRKVCDRHRTLGWLAAPACPRTCFLGALLLSLILDRIHTPTLSLTPTFSLNLHPHPRRRSKVWLSRQGASPNPPPRRQLAPSSNSSAGSCQRGVATCALTW